MGKHLFAEYLIEAGIVESDKMLEVFIDHIRKQPSIAEVVHNKKLMTSKQQLEVLFVQSKHNCDFQRACNVLGLWTEEFSQAIDSNLSLQMHIGKKLVESNAINESDLTKALDGFLSQKESNKKSESIKPAPIQESSPISNEGPDSNVDVALNIFGKLDQVSWSDFPSDFGIPKFISADLLAEFVKIMPDLRPKEVETTTNLWANKIQSNDRETIINDLRNLHRELQSIVAGARFLGIKSLEMLITSGLSYLERLLSANPPLDAIAGIAAKNLSTLYEIAWEVRDIVVRSSSGGGPPDSAYLRPKVEAMLLVFQSNDMAQSA